MNEKQKIALWAGLIVIQLMVLLPPVSRPHVFSGSVDTPPSRYILTVWSQSYGLIIRDYKNIKFSLLAGQLTITAAATAALIYTLREKQT